jgi:hypothetical protein
MMHAGLAALRLIAPALLVFGSVLPVAAAPAADLAAEEVHSVYVNAGLTVSTPTYSTDGVATFSVDTPGELNPGQPGLRVFVYLNSDRADAEHRQLHTGEEARRNANLLYSDDVGPQLLFGYGPSLWRQNVALIQLAPLDDVGAHAQEIECGADGTSITPLPRTTVAPGYQAALENLLGGAAQASQ